MKILYISSVSSPEEFKRIRAQHKQKTVYGMNESGFKFHTLILEGLIRQKDVQIRSVVGRNVSFRSYPKLIWKTARENHGNLEYIHLGFLNFSFLKHITLGVSFFYQTLRWLHQNRDEEKAIVMDGAYITAHPFVLMAKKLTKCHTSAIFCDLYEYMADVKDARNTDTPPLSHRIARKVAAASYGQLDSFIFLTEAMNEVINRKNKPYIVIEGLVDIHMEESPNTLEKKDSQQVVMYAGALRAQYGLKNLIEGFTAYQNNNVVLKIYGDGDYVDSIREVAQKDSRIVYGGMISVSEVVQKEIAATLLVNARPANMEFTKYSFPSKNMEYMASGTPILTTRLPGMPQEYYDYIYTIDGDSPVDVTRALEKTFANSRKALHEKGMHAKEFVLTQKNNTVQAKRIYELLRGVEKSIL